MPLKLLNTIHTGFDLLPIHDNTCFRTYFWSEKEVTKWCNHDAINRSLIGDAICWLP